MRLTDRDKGVVRAVNDYRVMRQDQIQRLVFPSKTTAQRRLWRLWQHRFLKRSHLLVLGGVQNSPTLYRVDKRGAELLKAEFGYDKESLRWSGNKPLSDRFLNHTIGLGEVRLAFELSSRANQFSIKTWLDEKAIKKNYHRIRLGRRIVSVVPDAYVLVSIPTRGTQLHFFIEYDRSSESLNFFKRKIEAYSAYFQSGQAVKQYGTNRIRVLTVTEKDPISKNRTRARSLEKLAEKAAAHPWFWFANLSAVVANDILTEPVWRQTNRQTPTPLVLAPNRQL